MDRVKRQILDKAPLTAWWRQTGLILAQLRGHGAPPTTSNYLFLYEFR
jgi:hypothetical protein